MYTYIYILIYVIYIYIYIYIYTGVCRYRNFRRVRTSHVISLRRACMPSTWLSAESFSKIVYVSMHVCMYVKLLAIKLAGKETKPISRSQTSGFHMKFSQMPLLKREIGLAVYLVRPTQTQT